MYLGVNGRFIKINFVQVYNTKIPKLTYNLYDETMNCTYM
jgi:hypothetical protein